MMMKFMVELKEEGYT